MKWETRKIQRINAGWPARRKRSSAALSRCLARRAYVADQRKQGKYKRSKTSRSSETREIQGIGWRGRQARKNNARIRSWENTSKIQGTAGAARPHRHWLGNRASHAIGYVP